MDHSTCKLTLVYPPAAENRIVEVMLESLPPIGGFTTLQAEGHGHGFGDASMSERVRGRIARRMLIAVMSRERAAQVLAELEAKAPLQHLAYWLEPVIAFGHMAPLSAVSIAARGDGLDG
jgi:Protein of unknown function (DUF3240)